MDGPKPTPRISAPAGTTDNTAVAPQPVVGPYTYDDLLTFFKRSHQKLSAGQSPASINARLNAHTNGLIPNLPALAKALQDAGQPRDVAQSAQPSMASGAAGSALSGATLGAWPMLTQMAQSAGNAMGVGDGTNPQKVGAMAQTEDALFNRQHPVVAMGASALGGLPLGILTGEAALGTANPVRNAGLLFGTEGAVQGALQNPDHPLLGAGVGGLLGGAGGVVGAAYAPLTRRLTGPEALTQRSAANLATKAGLNAPDLASGMGGLDADLGAAGVAQPLATASDVPVGREVLGGLASGSGPAKVAAQQALRARDVAALQEVGPAIGRVAGLTPAAGSALPTSPAEVVAQRVAARSAEARQMYAGLAALEPSADVLPDVQKELRSIIQSAPEVGAIASTIKPTIQQARQVARVVAGQSGVALPASETTFLRPLLDAAGNPSDVTPNFLTLQRFKELLGQRLDAAYKAGNSLAIERLDAANTRLGSLMGDAFGDDYARVQSRYRALSNNVRAAEDGATVWQTRPRDIEQRLAGMSPDEAQAYRDVAQNEYWRQPAKAINAARDGTAPATAGARQELNQRMDLIFGKPVADQLRQTGGAFNQMLQTAPAALGNSPTAARTAMQKTLGMQAPVTPGRFWRYTLLRNVDPRRFAFQNDVQLGAPRLAGLLTSADPAQRAALLQLLTHGPASPSAFDALPSGLLGDAARQPAGLLRGGQ